jgi:PAS domain S-box-containing protein
MKKSKNGSIEILIAEDSPTQAEQLRQLLEENKFKVSIAPNGKAALAQIALRQPALVISDVMMPELDGYGLCKAIKSDETLKHIPVMLVTTLSDPGDVIRGLECGADNFIRKPYEEKYLVSRIDYLLMNVELRKNQRMHMALEIDIGGKKHFISAERQQILDLLVSTYEQAVQVNTELKDREKELAHSNQVLQGLNRIAQGLNSAVSESEVAEMALQRALELPGIQAGWISLHTGGSNFRLAAAKGLPPALSAPDAFKGGCACQKQLLNGDRSAGVNIVKCERLAKAKGDTQGICCHASIPLWLRNGQCLGVMNLAGHGNRLFNESELNVLHGVGNQIAVALERAMLHGHLEQLVDERTSALTMEIAERKRIQEQQSRLIAIIEATPDLIGTAMPDGRLLYVNQAGMRMMGVKADELPTLRIQDAHPEWAGKLVQKEGIPHALSHGFWSGETALLGPDGREIPVLQVILVHKGADGTVAYLSTIARDITQRKASEARIARLNRIYALLSGINTTIVRVQDEQELFKEACRIAVEYGQFTFAWIGKFDASSLRVTPVAQDGHHDGYLAQINLTADEGVLGSCALTAQALTEMKPAICNDIANDERMAPWRSAALDLGYRSVTVFPLMLEGRPFGVFALYSSETNAFDDEEMKLLIEMSGDISYALDNLRREARRKQAEDDLLKLSLAVEQSPNSIVITDLDANIEYVNQGFVKATGYGREEVIGQNPSILHSGKNPPGVYQDMWAHLTRGEIWKGEFINRRKDGSEYVESIFVSPVRNADGHMTHYLAIKEDITLHKQAETALRDSRESLDRILNSMAEGAYGVDTHGNCTFVNRAFLRLLGYQDVSELLGRHIHGLIHHSHADGSPYPASECRAYCAYQIDQPINVSDEVFWRKDGVAIPVEYWSHPIVTDGEVTGAITTFIDITERKRSEVALLQLNESLEQRVADRTMDLVRARCEADDANRAKSAFLSTMSHEIRTPMNGVVGMVEVLAQSRLSEHQADLVRTIRESANTLLGIIDDILDFSKIEAGRLELECVPVSITDLVEGLCNSLLSEVTRKGVALSTFISPDIPEQVLSDDLRLRQVLYNLVGNAIKFSARVPGKRGKVSVRVDAVQTAPLRLAFRVIDNGIGMAPETTSSLFTPFTQAEVSTTRRFGGTGLGLAISKRLVDLMHGEISVESTLGVGSTFTVTLPFEVPAQQPLHSLPDLSGLDCIVLESPEINAGDLSAYLEHVGAKVHLVADAATAVRLATQLPVPVVVILAAEHAEDIPAVLHAPLSVVPDMRYLLLTHGLRRRSRIEGPYMVSIDGDALRRLSLLRAVAVAAGRASPEIFHERQEEPLAGEVAPPTLAEARAQGRLILIAEDDEINQKVIRQQLSLLGYAGEIVANGADALRLWREGRYALLLTDLHMPEMDGYTLAETIRREEAGRSRMPIVVLTANALRGEASRAHAAGMDDYLTKPVQLELLRTTLEKWLPKTAENKLPGKQPEQSVEPPPASSVDVSVLKSMVGNDKTTVSEFLADYLASARRLAGEMRAALTAGNTQQVSSVAHKLKSSSRSVGAMALGDLCAELENAGKAGDKAATVQGMARFETALAQVEAEITALLE